jgi:hypothetical protein
MHGMPGILMSEVKNAERPEKSEREESGMRGLLLQVELLLRVLYTGAIAGVPLGNYSSRTYRTSTVDITNVVFCEQSHLLEFN